MFVIGARVHNTNFQPAGQSAGAFRFRNHGQCANKATNIQDIVTDGAFVHGVHALLIELFSCDKILVGQHKVTIISFQRSVGCSLKLTNNATRLFKVQSVESRHGCLILLHNAFVICILSAKQDTVFVHLYFAATREEQEASTVSQRVGKRREEVGLRW